MAGISQRVRRFARRFQRPTCCSACQTPRGSGRRLISGPGVYICEVCVREASSKTADTSPTRCSFCQKDGRASAAWPDVAICPDCVDLAERIFSEDNRRSPPAT